MRGRARTSFTAVLTGVKRGVTKAPSNVIEFKPPPHPANRGPSLMQLCSAQCFVPVLTPFQFSPQICSIFGPSDWGANQLWNCLSPETPASSPLLDRDVAASAVPPNLWYSPNTACRKSWMECQELGLILLPPKGCKNKVVMFKDTQRRSLAKLAMGSFKRRLKWFSSLWSRCLYVKMYNVPWAKQQRKWLLSIRTDLCSCKREDRKKEKSPNSFNEA